jgi:hypothetical protein
MGQPVTKTVIKKKSAFNRYPTQEPEPKITVGAGMIGMTVTFTTPNFVEWQNRWDDLEAEGHHAKYGIVSTIIGEIETVEKDVSLVTVMHIFPRNETTEAIFAEDPAIFVGGVELVTEGIITGEIQVAHTNITSGIDRTL